MKKISNKNKIDYVAIASHQMRTPLTLMKGYLAMILAGEYGAVEKLELKKALENVYHSNEELISLVENLLTKSRLETHDLKINRQQINIKKIMETVISDLMPKANAKGLKLVSIDNDTSGRIKADPLLIRQIFVNLIDNAIAYTKKGMVKVSLTQSEKRVTITVIDTGTGLTARQLKMLFSKFQLPHFISPQGGFGLGLYIVGLIVRAHGGKLLAKRGKSKGLEVICQLPVN